MNELNMIFVILVTLAVAYLWVYPTFAGNDIKKLQLYDIGLTAIPIIIAAYQFWVSNPIFNFLLFETNWFVFTLGAYLLFELPLFFWYLKARGLGRAYFDSLKFAFKGSENAAWSNVSIESVEKQLNDSKWDGLRTSGAKRFLFLGTNSALLGGTAFLLFVGNSVWPPYILIHLLIIGVFWFLLRQSVRLVADAPEEALDERLVKLRDRSYLIAYRYFSALTVVLVATLMGYAIANDIGPEGDGFSYQLSFTWPQVQAVFWLVMGYALTLPSLSLISTELKRGVKK